VTLTVSGTFISLRSLTPETLARAAIADLLASAGEDFQVAAERVLNKNKELYRRLA